MRHLPHLSLSKVAAAFMVSALAIAVSPIAALADETQPFLPDIDITSTIPANGDLNPYGVAFVPVGFPSGGPLAPGDILVSNFNNSGNAQGTGTTIIQFTPHFGIRRAAGVTRRPRDRLLSDPAADPAGR